MAVQPKNSSHLINSAKAELLDTGEIINLESKPGSNCHFFTPFNVGDEIIKLRLDWFDLDAFGNPTLDADFYNRETGEKRNLNGARKKAHHTSSSPNKNRAYTWEYKDCKKPFTVSICWHIVLGGTVTPTGSLSIKIIRAERQ